MNDVNVLVIGCKGNMGRRYIAILKYLGVKHRGVDEGEYILSNDATHVIIAAPTNIHHELLSNICSLRDHPIKILCEKPFFVPDPEDEEDGWDSLSRMTGLLKKLHEKGHKTYMVNNYAYYPFSRTEGGPTQYSYYNSGKDGIVWDCIQLIHLARHEIYLSNNSPRWQTVINGESINKDRIDAGYIDMVADFVLGMHGKLWGFPDIVAAHLKTLLYEQEHKKDAK